MLVLCTSCTSNAPVGGSDPEPTEEGLAIYAENPAYWSYNGRPTVLIGGSREDNLFQIDGLEAHLEALSAAGGNYIRNTLSSRDTGNVWAFARNEDGLYDLERFDTAYFNRLQRLLEWTHERDIIVQFEMWDRFDFARDPWLSNPYRPANNINYDTTASGLQDLYPRHPGSNDNPFFFAVPALDSNALVLKYQRKYIDKVLEIALNYGHILYCMDNETNGDPAWGAYWAQYLKEKAAARGKTIFTTEMWDAWDLKDEEHLATFDHPELYDFIDISQNNHNKGQEHWDNLHWVREYIRDGKRPLNHVKIYGAETSRYGSERDALERFWRSLLGGAASIRFHRPPSGLGLSAPVQQSLRAARLLLDSFDLHEAQPDVTSEKLLNRSDNEAFLSYIDGRTYLLYFPDGGAVDLDLTGHEGTARVQWLSILDDRPHWQQAATIAGGKPQPLEVPGSGHWLALVQF
ncbi:hypothetical protein CRP01_02715 [Flavilitoribacter nigricans DSM 23189 = NBRC 102662]|uniref:Collagen-binding domain-containing protein n=1 Tax=Flavilitoribacter nigricans (strain ATCC 23147 / DSM 23189 / NBRC 102662 / NCIMB 1420 / SS-2) TaxID=1122177 RepID=A0A2D0NIC8_FLAN2|nr:hypothetical protein CRP01_02715 [Flavilitoribacter nigricans DSM 23189 = NBRC 102662]